MMNNRNTQTVQIKQLVAKLSTSVAQTISFFESQLNNDGSYDKIIQDIACYFKSPMLFLAANKLEKASLLLNYIKNNFMLSNGDFCTNNKIKSINPAYNEYWSYTNGWILRAAIKLNFTDIIKKSSEYLDLYHVKGRGFLTNCISENTETIDVLTVAHHGLVNLELDNLDTAILAGDYLFNIFDLQQDNINDGFFLRINKNGNLLREFSSDQKLFYCISKIEKNQLHFMIGYPSAFLTLLYLKTKNQKYLDLAKAYIDFSLSCDPSVYECNFSHKLAWAASLLYKATGDNQYLIIIDKMSNYFISNQCNGVWFKESLIDLYDQSAEIACWFIEIVNNIQSYKN
jgi:hypothetical protein